ncbi:hypothetical protein HDU76_005784 [Blyttiomyces sp. JEL0837]|nr:hypothetical protein HDU76_005784 [Blyttiomyces sp. JEL0837]
MSTTNDSTQSEQDKTIPTLDNATVAYLCRSVRVKAHLNAKDLWSVVQDGVPGVVGAAAPAGVGVVGGGAVGGAAVGGAGAVGVAGTAVGAGAAGAGAGGAGGVGSAVGGGAAVAAGGVGAVVHVAPTRADLVKKNHQAAAIILSKLSESMIETVVDLLNSDPSAKLVWDSLKSQHDRATAAKTLELQAQLLDLKYQNDGNMTAHLGKITLIVFHLKQANVNITDIEHIMHIFWSLPRTPEWTTLSTALK